MCGIWALFGCDERVEKYFPCFMKIAHRGPDAFRLESVSHFQSCRMGFHHLAIMDQKTGLMPLKLTRFPDLTLIYNGEIYNYGHLAKEFGFEYHTMSDAECILHLYDKGGIDFACKHLDGVFGFLLLDMANSKIHIARDTYGVRPLFKILSKDGLFGACSEAKGLIGLRKMGQIKVVMPGHYETYDLDNMGKVSLRQVAQFNAVGQAPVYKTFEENTETADVCAKIRILLTEAVRKRMMGQRRIGCLLSGGLDSSLVTALVVKLAKEMNLGYPIQTFSIGMAKSPDLIAGKKVSQYLGTDHHEVYFTPEEGLDALNQIIYHMEGYDTITLRGAVGHYLLCKYIAENTENIVIFSGEGSDEVTQGYIYFRNATSPEDADSESRRLLRDLHMYDVQRADKMTAAHGLELRVPFLDHKFSSSYLDIPAELRQPTNGIEKYLLRKAFDNTGLLPSKILWRQKEGFSDGISSKKKSWFEIVQEYVDQKVEKTLVEDATEAFQINSPRTKEEYYYRQLFESYYPGHGEWTPFFWMPKWCIATDPSAR